MGVMTRSATVKRAKRPTVNLPALVPFRGAGWEPDGDYDGVEFTDLDCSGQDGGGAHFLDCRLSGVTLNETRLTRARIVDTVLSGARGVGTDLAEATLRDAEVVDARLGGVQLHGAHLERVVVRGGKIDYLNLRQARLKDVVFESVVLVEPDFGGATLERVEFHDCVLKGVDFGGARMRDVDLRGADQLEITRGVEGLRGAVISPSQLLDLAWLFAGELGVRVEG
ncbi:pentapeptide repeat-containing protein [Streptomyces sp. NPDC005955]|uniref:pentapeptide repeat-containing protein n=1 Tax=Streptomyces sp. NPDC005955 TaxID=3364738 RepID=UPI003685E5C4